MKKVQKTSKSTFELRWVIFLLLFLFVGIRLVHLPEVMMFGTDMGRDFLTTYNMFVNKNVVVLGPPSQYTVDGRAFFFGPAPYYLMLPGLLIGNWNPLAASYYLIFLNLGVLMICLSQLRKQVKDSWVLLFFVFFCTLTPAVISYTRNYWNPHFMFAVSLLLLPMLLSKDKHGKYFYAILGFLFGLGLQFHYSFIFAIVMGILWLFLKKKLGISSLVTIFFGFLFGFLPIIAYELKNDFYNLKTLILVFTSPVSSQNQFKINGLYYFISLVPFFFFSLSVAMAKVREAHAALIYLFLAGFAVWAFITVWTMPQAPFGYLTVQKLASSIESDHPEDYNVVDQLTRDNQAMALRYLLTVHGFAPHKEGDYTSAKFLYIYSREPLDNLLRDPIYEIKSFLPFKSMRTWEVEDEINIYKLEK